MHTLYILPWNVFSTISWILCFQHGTSKSSMALEVNKKEEGSSYLTVNDGRVKLYRHLHTDSHDNDRTFTKHRKHDTLQFPVFTKQLVMHPKNLQNEGKSASVAAKTVYFIPPQVTVHNKLGSSQGNVDVRENKHKQSYQNLNSCVENVLCNMCLRFIKRTVCLRIFFRSILLDKFSRSEPSDDSLEVNGFHQRKLLGEQQQDHIDPDTSTEDQVEIKEADVDLAQVTFSEEIYLLEHSDTGLTEEKKMEKLSKLVEELRRDISKEPVWAMISVSVLMLVLVLVSKMCGLRVANRSREIHIDVESDFHNVTVAEVLRVKRRYLPKSLSRITRKLRRKLRKKPKRIKEKDISEPMSAEPLSDSSEEEALIYDRNNAV